MRNKKGKTKLLYSLLLIIFFFIGTLGGLSALLTDKAVFSEQLKTGTWDYSLSVDADGSKNGIWKGKKGVTLLSLQEPGTVIDIPDPSAAGYTFKGWTAGSDNKGTFNASTKKYTIAVGSKDSLKAQYAVIPYTITYNLDGGTEPGNPTGYNVETASFTLKQPKKYGYKFAGWTGSNGTTAQTSVTIAKGSTGNRSYTAHWNPDFFTVQFNANGGTGTMGSEVYLYTDNKALTPNAFTRTGYAFNNWNTKADGSGTSYTNGQVVKNLADPGKTLVLYAQWTPYTYTIKYDMNGGMAQKISNFAYTGAVQSYTAPYDGTYKLEVWGAQGGYRSNAAYAGKGGYSVGTVTLKAGTKLYVYAGGSGNTGRTNGGFNGGGSRATYNGGGGASDIRIGTDSLYARVIVAGGGGSDGNPSYSGAAGGGTSGGSAASGCGSGGGGATQTGTGTSGSGTAGSFGQGGKGVYYANGYGGAGGGGWYGGSGTYPDGSVDDDKGGGGGSGYIYTASTASSYPSGCLLNSSYYLTNASTTQGTASMPSTSGGAETGHAGDGYARITYTGTMADTIAVYDQNVTLRKNTFTKDHYWFCNWNTAADGSGTSYADEAVVKNLTAVNKGTVTMYAQWENPKLSFSANGGKFQSGSSTVTLEYKYNGSTYTTPSYSEPSRTGYSFVGWNTKADGTGTAYATEDKMNSALDSLLEQSDNGPLVLYAQWKYTTIVFDANGGTFKDDGNNNTGNTTRSVNYMIVSGGYSATPAYSETFAKCPTGMDFAGWTATADGSGTVYSQAQLEANLAMQSDGTLKVRFGSTLTNHVYVKWQPPFHITYHSNLHDGEKLADGDSDGSHSHIESIPDGAVQNGETYVQTVRVNDTNAKIMENGFSWEAVVAKAKQILSTMFHMNEGR